MGSRRTTPVWPTAAAQMVVQAGNAQNSLGQIHDDTLQVEMILNDVSQAPIDRVLLKISEELFRLTGFHRPAGFVRISRCLVS